MEVIPPIVYVLGCFAMSYVPKTTSVSGREVRMDA